MFIGEVYRALECVRGPCPFHRAMCRFPVFLYPAIEDQIFAQIKTLVIPHSTAALNCRCGIHRGVDPVGYSGQSTRDRDSCQSIDRYSIQSVPAATKNVEIAVGIAKAHVLFARCVWVLC